MAVCPTRDRAIRACSLGRIGCYARRLHFNNPFIVTSPSAHATLAVAVRASLRRRRIVLMAKTGTYLRPELDVGSSRVFNCNDIARRLEKKKVENRFFFKNASMNTLVLIKEALTEERSEPHPSGFAIGMKLYIPYNEANVYEGGRSVFCHSKQLTEVLNQHFGFAGDKVSKEDVERDLKVLSVLDKLPSLDVFLMRDALELEGLKTNANYFEIEETQR